MLFEDTSEKQAYYGFQRTLDWVMNQFAVSFQRPSLKNVVDIGCGRMPYGTAFLDWLVEQHPNSRLFAIDRDEQALDYEHIKDGKITFISRTLSESGAELVRNGVTRVGLFTMFNPNHYVTDRQLDCLLISFLDRFTQKKSIEEAFAFPDAALLNINYRHNQQTPLPNPLVLGKISQGVPLILALDGSEAVVATVETLERYGYKTLFVEKNPFADMLQHFIGHYDPIIGAVPF